ncbi:hypothetical protein PAMP_002682 [Pampus punctatissimus]
MKLLQDSEDAKAKRKILKPQVERRRRERMNRSLESLKTLLLQQQEETQRRVEKAEILEHTVLFLQNTVKGDNTRAEGGGQKHSFQDGFSTCLQRAAQFLGPEGKGLLLGAALDSARFARLDCDSAGVQPSLVLKSSSRSVLRMLIHRSKHRLYSSSLSGASCAQSHRDSLWSSTVPQHTHKVLSRVSNQNQAVSQSLWRPWP